jgi:hypothetical protein
MADPAAVAAEALKQERLEAALERRRAAAAAAAEAAEAAAAARVSDYSAPIEPTARSSSSSSSRASSSAGGTSAAEPVVLAAAEATPRSWGWGGAADADAPPIASSPEREANLGNDGLRRRSARRDHDTQPAGSATHSSSAAAAPGPPTDEEDEAAAVCREADESTASWLVLVLTFTLTLGSMHFCVAIERPEKAPALVLLVVPLLLMSNARLTEAATALLQNGVVAGTRHTLRRLRGLPSTVAGAVSIDDEGDLSVSEEGWAVLGICVGSLLVLWLLKTCFTNAEVCGSGIVSFIGFIFEILT